MAEYWKRGAPVEVEDVPEGSAYRVNDGGIISYHPKETFALLYEKNDPAAIPIDVRPHTSTPTPVYTSVGTTAQPIPDLPGAPKVVVVAATKTEAAPHWEGDTWVDGDYRVDRKFVNKYYWLYGPEAVDPDHGSGGFECNDALTKWMAGIIKKITGIEETGGLYSTWSERHCAETALYIGYLDIESTADIPPVPKFWISEAQYWYPHIIIGRQLRKLNLVEYIKNNPKIWALLAGAVTAGYAALPYVLKGG